MPMTEKQETLRDLLRQWKEAAQMLKNVPIVSDMDPVCREAIRQLEGRSAELAPIVERLEQRIMDYWKDSANPKFSGAQRDVFATCAYEIEREVLGRKD